MTLTGFEQRKGRGAPIGRDLQRAALESGCPEIETFHRLETEMLGVPGRRLCSVGYTNVHVIELAHSERCLIVHEATLERTSGRCSGGCHGLAFCDLSRSAIVCNVGGP